MAVIVKKKKSFIAKPQIAGCSYLLSASVTQHYTVNSDQLSLASERLIPQAAASVFPACAGVQEVWRETSLSLL